MSDAALLLRVALFLAALWGLLTVVLCFAMMVVARDDDTPSPLD